MEFKNILDSVPCGICQVALDEKLTILYANQYYYQIYGYTSRDVEERGFTNAKFILPDSDYQLILDAVYHHIQQGDRHFQLEFRGVHSTGKLMWLLVRCAYYPECPESMLCVVVDIADRKRMEEELNISMEEIRIAYQLTDKIMYIFDVAEMRLSHQKMGVDEFGLSEVVNRVPYSVVESGAIDEASIDDYIEFYESIMRGKPSGHTVVKKRRKDNSFGWYEAKFSTIFDAEGNAKKAIISCEDITRQREKELTYQKWSQYFKSQEGKTIGYYEYNLTRDEFDEEAGDDPPDYLRSLTGYTQTVHYVAEHFVYEGDRERFYNFFNRDTLLIRHYNGQTRGVLDYLRKREDGRLYWVRAITLLLEEPYSSDVRLFMMTIDIDKEKREELKLRSQTEHDGMTGLLNRETFIARVSQIIDRKDYTRCHALIMLDIDKFKQHNDIYGHPFGDRVIHETAQLIQGFLRKSDLCGRMGGDEFMVFLNDITSESEVIPRIDRLCQLLKQSYTEGGEVSCSMGVVFYPGDGETFREMYQNADIALYQAKKAGRGNYKIFCRDKTDKK